MEKITKEKFNEYLIVQELGFYNMLDPKARELTSLNKKEWLEIIKNYSKLKKLWEQEV
tara:strand:+ start:655 stop:828 length:174 start_codon:yes stop_codon:yes gene_type:complete